MPSFWHLLMEAEVFENSRSGGQGWLCELFRHLDLVSFCHDFAEFLALDDGGPYEAEVFQCDLGFFDNVTASSLASILVFLVSFCHDFAEFLALDDGGPYEAEVFQCDLGFFDNVTASILAFLVSFCQDFAEFLALDDGGHTRLKFFNMISDSLIM